MNTINELYQAIRAPDQRLAKIKAQWDELEKQIAKLNEELTLGDVVKLAQDQAATVPDSAMLEPGFDKEAKT